MKIGKKLLSGSNSCEDFEWEDLLSELDLIIEKKGTDFWKAKMSNFGWNNQSGEKKFIANNAKDLLSKILPNTECNFNIFNYGKGLAIQNSHHDSPCGNEWYYIVPISAITYYKNN